MQVQTTSCESKFPNECSGVIFIQIDQHLKKLLKLEIRSVERGICPIAPLALRLTLYSLTGSRV